MVIAISKTFYHFSLALNISIDEFEVESMYLVRQYP
jgi:hypothetical protein